MAYAKDNPPIGESISARQAYLDRELFKIEQDFRLLREQAAEFLAKMVFSAYGGISDETAGDPGWNIPTATWQTVDVFDTIDPNSRGISAVLPDALVFDSPGFYASTFQLAAEIVDSNQGRTFQIRLLNRTQGVASGSITWGVGRNVDAINISLTAHSAFDLTGSGQARFLGHVMPMALGDEFVFQLGQASSTIDITTVNGASWYANNLAPFEQIDLEAA